MQALVKINNTAVNPLTAIFSDLGKDPYETRTSKIITFRKDFKVNMQMKRNQL